MYRVTEPAYCGSMFCCYPVNEVSGFALTQINPETNFVHLHFCFLIYDPSIIWLQGIICIELTEPAYCGSMFCCYPVDEVLGFALNKFCTLSVKFTVLLFLAIASGCV